MININFNEYLDEFNTKTSKTNYMRHGAFKSEMYAIYCLYKQLNCNLFIESGLCNGVSTNTLLSVITDEYIGIDTDRNCLGSHIKKPNFRFLHGAAEDKLFDLIQPDKTIFIFMDGPKGKEATALKDKLLNEHENVKAVAIHDTYDGLEEESHLRIFETRSNTEYNNKYFETLNQKNNNTVATIYNTQIYDTIDGKLIWKNYIEWYPSGPGLSIYSKLDLNFII